MQTSSVDFLADGSVVGYITPPSRFQLSLTLLAFVTAIEERKEGGGGVHQDRSVKAEQAKLRLPVFLGLLDGPGQTRQASANLVVDEPEARPLLACLQGTDISEDCFQD